MSADASNLLSLTNQCPPLEALTPSCFWVVVSDPTEWPLGKPEFPWLQLAELGAGVFEYCCDKNNKAVMNPGAHTWERL